MSSHEILYIIHWETGELSANRYLSEEEARESAEHLRKDNKGHYRIVSITSMNDRNDRNVYMIDPEPVYDSRDKRITRAQLLDLEP